MTSEYAAADRALRRIELTVRRRLDGIVSGDYLGLLPGPGSELAEAREYQPHDDVRRMDWNVTARSSSPHVREVIADRELSTWVLVDATASMDFGTTDMEKRDLAIAAVAALGVLTGRAGNRIGAVIMASSAQDQLIRRFPARSGRGHLLALLRNMAALPRTVAGMRTPTLADGIASLAGAARKRGFVAIVSDFQDGLLESADPPWVNGLRRMTARHEVLAVGIADPRELELPPVGLVTLTDPETGRRREVSTADHQLRQRFADAAREQQELIAAAVRRAGATYLPLRTDRDWVRDVARHVLLQRRRVRRRPA